MGEASIGRGGGSPVGSGCGAISHADRGDEAVAMIMEKRLTLRIPGAPFPKGHRAAWGDQCLRVTPTVSLVFILTLRF